MTDSELKSADYLSILWRWKWRILLSVIVCILAAGGVSFLLPKIYQGTLILLIVPPKFQTELKPATLSMETYQRLGESAEIRQKLVDRLKEEGILKEDQGIEDLGELRTGLIKGPRREEAAPLVELIVETKGAQKAARAANLWGQIFVEHYRELMMRETTALRDYILEQYKIAKENYEKAEKAVMEFELRNNLALLERVIQVKTERLAGVPVSEMRTPVPGKRLGLLVSLADLQLEIASTAKRLDEVKQQVRSMEEGTLWAGIIKPGEPSEEVGEERFKDAIYKSIVRTKQNLIDAGEARKEFLNQKKIEFLNADVASQRKALVDYKMELSNVQIRLKATQEASLETLKLIQEEPKLVTLSKAITDQALWDAILSEPAEEGLKKVGNLLLRTEEMNPHYLNLDKAFVNLQVEYNTLKAREIRLKEEIAQREEQLVQDEAKLNESLLGLEYLTKAVELAKKHYETLANLFIEKKKEMETLNLSLAVLRAEEEVLSREVEEATEEISRLKNQFQEKSLELARLQREAERYKVTYDLLSQKAEEARMAEAEEPSDVKIATRAVVPDKPIKPKKKLIVFAAGLVSLMVGVALAFILESVPLRVQRPKA